MHNDSILRQHLRTRKRYGQAEAILSQPHCDVCQASGDSDPPNLFPVSYIRVASPFMICTDACTHGSSRHKNPLHNHARTAIPSIFSARTCSPLSCFIHARSSRYFSQLYHHRRLSAGHRSSTAEHWLLADGHMPVPFRELNQHQRCSVASLTLGVL